MTEMATYQTELTDEAMVRRTCRDAKVSLRSGMYVIESDGAVLGEGATIADAWRSAAVNLEIGR